MTTPASLRSVLIGSDSLLIQCGEALLQRNHSIHFVITDEPRIATWAKSHSLEVLDPQTEYVTRLEETEYDALFSITWLSVLPERVLNTASKYAINFHDGPLPAYAGLYTPAWALLHREAQYGVTWHTMVAGVDRGDILEQEHFELHDGETSLTLNTRCFEAALESFGRLLDGLERDELRPASQDGSQRSYFGKFKRPSAFCSLDWSATSHEAEALTRALEFGRYPNPLGTAKMFTGSDYVTVREVRIAEGNGQPGEILSLTDTELVVATSDSAVAISRLEHACGAPLAIATWVASHGFKVGSVLPVPSAEERQTATEFHEALARHETFWTRRLTTLEPLELPWTTPRNGADDQHKCTSFTLPTSFTQRFAGESFEAACWTLVATYLARVVGKSRYHVATPAVVDSELVTPTAPNVAMEVAFESTSSFPSALESFEGERATLAKRQTWTRDLVQRAPALHASREFASDRILPVGIQSAGSPIADVSFAIDHENQTLQLHYDPACLESVRAEAIVAQLETWANSVSAEHESLAELEFLSDAERNQVLFQWNATEVDYSRTACVHELFASQAIANPHATAIVRGADELTYSELDARANQIANALIQRGVCSGDRVGLHLERTVDLVATVFGILKTGAAYVPLDPDFPADRIAFMVQDSNAKAIVTTTQLCHELPEDSAALLCLDEAHAELQSHPTTAPDVSVEATDVAYSIYTSGSTGTPKGVLVEHRNAVNFFVGMDERVGREEPGVWLAVTSLSFDISVLELVWTACRGFKTVLYGGLRHQGGATNYALDFGLSFFASNKHDDVATQYEFLFNAAQFADENGFRSIWTPERHFHDFGGLYPNPSVTSAALAAVTENIELRSGSVVVALHHPIRIAEEWSLVDNLSKGRIGISIASGWHPNDFVLAPDAYDDRKNLMVENTEIVRKLWRGESVEFTNPKGQVVPTKIMPKPVQPELPLWVTAAGNPETFRQAGELGANVLTHLLGQSTEELGAKLAVYHEAWKQAGHSGKGAVTLMLHTFIGEDVDEVRETVRGPMRDYLRSAVDLIKNHVSSWSAVKKSVDGGKAPEIGSLEDLPAEDLEALLDYSFERYFETSALFGTPESVQPMLSELHELGIDEITCLVDFGVPCALVMESLPRLNDARRIANERLGSSAGSGDSIAELIGAHDVTHFQCTPSMAAVLVEDEATVHALGKLEVMMVGGEPFPLELANRLGGMVNGRVVNMYGPTETTIWSSTVEVAENTSRMTIGTPIANTQLYVLDAHNNPLPVGAPGELYIGGDGVTRGYHERPDLTEERFVANPFRDGERMYRTGDVARWLEDGTMEFLGRVDHQVKIRGYRIELGEIETALDRHEQVAQAVVVASEQHGSARLVAHLIPEDGQTPEPKALAAHLSESLPEYMIPEEFRFHESYPLTPNKKVDRKALATFEPAPAQPAAPVVEKATPKPTPSSGDESHDLEDVIEKLLVIWRDVLGTLECGPDENFFDLGGHSLLTIRVQKAIKEELGINVPLVDMFRFTTVRTLAERLAPSSSESDAQESSGQSRAAQRAARRRRRGS